MDALSEWLGGWVRWVSLAWVVFAFVLGVAASAVFTLPERRALRRAEGAHWTERALRRFELQVATFSVLLVLVLTGGVCVLGAAPPPGVVSTATVAGLTLAAVALGSVVFGRPVAPRGSTIFGAILLLFAIMPWFPAVVAFWAAPRWFGHPEVLVVVAGAAAAVLERVPTAKLLAFVGVAQRMPERDAEVGGAAFWRVATRGLFLVEDTPRGEVLIGDGTYEALTAEELRTLMVPSRPGEPPMPTGPSILPLIVCVVLQVWFKERAPWLGVVSSIALGIYAWRLAVYAQRGARQWDGRERADREAQARALERCYEAALSPSLRMFGIPSMRERLEAMGHAPDWPAPKWRGLPWMRTTALFVVALFAWVLFPRVLSSLVPPDRAVGVGVALGTVHAPTLIAAAQRMDPEDPHRYLLLELAFDATQSDRDDADIARAYVDFGDCAGAERIAARSGERARTDPERQGEVVGVLAMCGPWPAEAPTEPEVPDGEGGRPEGAGGLAEDAAGGGE